MSMVSSDDIMNFLVAATDGHKSSTKKLKYSLLKTFFNFIKNSIDQNLNNPCDSPILQKTFKATKNQPWTILDKDVVDEIIFKTPDALFNGEATVRVVESCCPYIKDAKDMPSIDVDALLVAIHLSMII